MMGNATRIARVLGLALSLALPLALGAASVRAGDTGSTGVVNVNTATVAELQLLPGIGESRARAVVAERKRRGGFKSVDELVEVKGIGDAGLAKLRPFVRTHGKTTVSAK
jgi:competence protein ComEA